MVREREREKQAALTTLHCNTTARLLNSTPARDAETEATTYTQRLQVNTTDSYVRRQAYSGAVKTLVVMAEPVPLPKLTDGYLGKQSKFDEYGLTTLSHSDPVIYMAEDQQEVKAIDVVINTVPVSCPRRINYHYLQLLLGCAQRV